MTRLTQVLLAATLELASLGARVTELVVWWERTFYVQVDAGRLCYGPARGAFV